jgi:hypothetical protein
LQSKKDANPYPNKIIRRSSYWGGGIRAGAKEIPEYQHQDVLKDTMARLRMGVRLAKATHLPILVTGCRPDKVNTEDLPEGKLMATVLEKELQTPVI